MKYLKSENKYIVRIDKGEEVVYQIQKICIENNITAGSISGLGGTNRVVVGLLNTTNNDYISKQFVGNFEITSLIGNISKMNDEVYLHINIAISDENMNLNGGHLNQCYISSTCEVIIDAIDLDVNRKYNEGIGLNLYEI
ncbi:MAG: DNA-binding protein [Clostridia bacterium]|nr:DNA-binding protein [Clostridia bacterium]MDD4386596.1 DNA-binding protein [Clostridia bacterium]